MCVFEPDDDLSMRVNVVDTVDYAATAQLLWKYVLRWFAGQSPLLSVSPLLELQVRTLVAAGLNLIMVFCLCYWLLMTFPTNLVCSQPTWGFCHGQPSLSCNFPAGSASNCMEL